MRFASVVIAEKFLMPLVQNPAIGALKQNACVGTTAYTSSGAINLRASHQKEEFGPIEEGCECFACTHHTRAYLRHLLKAGEILGLRMLSVHNSHFFLEVMRDIRRHLAGGTFDDYRKQFIANYKPTSKVIEGRANSRLTG